ncbi:CYTH domain-containing protein [Vreelandella malpeensis]|uniref:CYTH domain-containing protein n=1 Tax=Vreelandella malpeensis TaxID=1172368 RepID=A0ABS8DRG0_9GAMM|nr:CYTH domain-containing protein [Halomonas malpeensis]MCB8888907.1 CYTH domain-containing protein [Halomonas malpeensis]
MKNANPLEIELKLALPTTSLEAVERHPLLAESAETLTLANTYFDTPNGALSRAGIALRLRRQGDRTLQTVKTRGQGGGGLSTRQEWEWSVNGALDLDALAALPPFEGTLDEALGKLAPVLATDFVRRRWLVEHQGSTIELVLDQGEIRAGEARATIQELELELKAGNAESLWALALALAEAIPLRPSESSKAARGNQLSRGAWPLPDATTPSQWLHRGLIALDAHLDSADDTFQADAKSAFTALTTHSELDETLRPTAQTLLDTFDTRGSDPHFGHAALALAHRLAIESALS